MKTNFKRICASVMVAVMLSTVTPLSGLAGIELPSFADLFSVEVEAATSGECGPGLSWSYSEAMGSLTITGSGQMTDYIFEDAPWVSIKDKILTVFISDGVTTIGNNAFYEFGNLTHVRLPESLTSIYGNAFNGCVKLKSIIIHKNVSYISPDTFNRCYALEGITVDADNNYYSNDKYGALFNKSKTEIYVYPMGSAATSYTVPDTVKSMSAYAFSGCVNLESLYISENVEDIGNFPLQSSKLVNIVVDENNPYYSSEDSVIFNKDKTTILVYPKAKADTSYTVPSTVTSIAWGAFHYNKNLTEVIIPEGVTSIGFMAFTECDNLTDVVLPATLTSIDTAVFSNCDKLVNVFYSGTEEQWNTLLESTNSSNDPLLESVVHYNTTAADLHTHVTETVTEAPTCTDYGTVTATCGCGLTYSYYVSSLGHDRYVVEFVPPVCGETEGYKYYNCHECDWGFTEVIGFDHVKGEAIKSVNPICGLEYGYTAYDCIYCDEEIHDDLIRPVKHSFVNDVCEHCNAPLIEISLDELQEVNIDSPGGAVVFSFYPMSSTKYHFYSDSQSDTYGYLQSVDFSKWTENDNDGDQDNFHIAFTISFGLSYYYTARFASRDETGTFYVKLSKDYTSCHHYEESNLGASCITDGATLYDCSVCGYSYSTATEAYGHSYVDGICEHCGWVEGLEYDIVNDEVEIIEYTGDKTELVIPSSLCGFPVVKIGAFAFSGCTDITSITLPETVSEIGTYSFNHCLKLQSINIPSSVTSIAAGAFAGCESLVRFTIPEGITTISESTFSACYSLTDVIIPDTVTSIENNAFYVCGGLTNVFYAGDRPEWESIYIINDNDSNSYLLSSKIHCKISAEDVDTHLNTTVITNPGCTSVGVMGVTCGCGYDYTQQIPALGHDLYVYEIVEPVCGGTDGYTRYNCTRCYQEFADNYIRIDHTASELIKSAEATCTKRGYNLYECGNCQVHYYEYTDALGHTLENGQCTRCSTVLPVLQMNVYTDVAVIEPSETVYFSFTPEESGTYYFYSDSQLNTLAYLYDSQMNLLSLNDDYEDFNFMISYDLSAGQTYYYVTRLTFAEQIGNYKVMLTTDFSSVHNYVIAKTVVQSCLKPGYDVIECSICANRYEDNYTEPVGHNYVDGVCQNCDCHEYNHLLDFKVKEGASTVIDMSNYVIYGLAPGITLDELWYDYLDCCDNIILDCYSDTGALGTGGILMVYDDAYNSLAAYTILIFGDVNGDGWYDGQDAVLVSCIINGMLTEEQVGPYNYRAADCNRDGVVDEADVALLNEAAVLLSSVDQTETAEELSTSSAYSQYVSLIDQSADITLESEDDAVNSEETQFDFFEQIFAIIQKIFDFVISLIKI